MKIFRTRKGTAQPFAILSAMESSGSRRGFSLLEVILSTAILMGSAIVLGRLAWMGRTQSNRALNTTQAQQLCEQTLNEIMLGLRSTELVLREPLLPVEASVTDSQDTLDSAAFEDEFESPEETELAATGLDQNGEPVWLHSVRLEPHNAFDGISVLTVAVMQSPESVSKPAAANLTRWVRHRTTSSPDEKSDDRFGVSPFKQLAGGFNP
jgi:type II secretory pathway pseudopilin PulG